MTLSLDFGHKTFTRKQDIKPWLDNFLLKNGGSSIVIERSDMNKIVFKCKSQKGRSKSKAKGCSRRAIICPFKIRANFSIRNSCWTLVVLNDHHNHELDHGLSSGSTTPDKAKSAGVDSKTLVLPPSPSDKHSGNDKLSDLSYLVLHELESEKSLEHGDKRPAFVSGGRKSKRQRKLSQPAQDEFSFGEELVKTLVEQVNQIIKTHVSHNCMLSEESKPIVIRALLTNVVHEYKETLGASSESLKSLINPWFSTSSAAMNNNPSANLIPLSPLLNDSDPEYHNNSGNTNSNNTSIESLTLPVISSSMNGANSGANSMLNHFSIPGSIQLSQIQNQSQQLPSFNSIQNNLPTSPSSMVSNSTASLFSSASGSSSILPLNTNNTTLNPSHLFKTTKNSQSANGSLNNLLNLDLKQSFHPGSNSSMSAYLGNLPSAFLTSVPPSLGQSTHKADLKMRNDSDNE